MVGSPDPGYWSDDNGHGDEAGGGKCRERSAQKESMAGGSEAMAKAK